mgnify:CR=1 FL=1
MAECKGIGGVAVYPDHFTQIDDTVTKVGTLLEQHSLGEQVFIIHPLAVQCD